ncbi:MAG: hypothetical protein KatS3mg051_2034 [Anaerolineae bacterium]|nr:MAG: hypothetical protein KatS3mg051_2034 [Anaerolineae bacterium]
MKRCGNCRRAPVYRWQRCLECWNYRQLFGRERPPRYWHTRAVHGWCDCGEPAVCVVRVRVAGTTMPMPLCQSCWELEQEMWRDGTDVRISAGAAIRATMRW